MLRHTGETSANSDLSLWIDRLAAKSSAAGKVTVAVAIAAMALTACGKVGELERPAPLYGAKAKADYQARKAADAAAKAEKKDDGEPEVLPDVTYDPNADPSPQRGLPIPGTNPAPNEPGPSGALPDPFNHPSDGPG